MNFLGACGTLIGHPLDTIKTWQQFGNRRIRKSVYDIIVQNNGVSSEFIKFFISFVRFDIDFIDNIHS